MRWVSRRARVCSYPDGEQEFRVGRCGFEDSREVLHRFDGRKGGEFASDEVYFFELGGVVEEFVSARSGLGDIDGGEDSFFCEGAIEA